MALPATGFTANTVNNFVIDAATVFTDFEYDDTGSTFTGTSLGATSGGVKVSISLEKRKAEVDGAYTMDVQGLWFTGAGRATATVPLKELTAETLRRSLNGTITAAAVDEAPTGYAKIESKRYIESTDYITKIGVVGVHSGTGKPIVFVLDNALVTNALETDLQDQGEAIVEQELTANATVTQLNSNQYPWRIFHPEMPVVTP